ncbi:hypothetical protein GRI43_01065 [Altererythrobacter luteolus]|uniref:Phage shock protein B n=1 Tax=Pontixanthobacter luteolus TaxID=295089 RepID=A0A6I4V221_9SPHN|nr:fructose-1,6-bisphosphatase [Pontixanthobacter luteolus]MXP45982.1 hypothetical protein [Pontixanthobacter luteolus]
MGELAIIFGFILIVTIVSLGFGSSMHKRQIAYKERKEAIERGRSDAAPSASAKKIEKLEQRVRVLERLATDRGQDLASQIEDLRSLPDSVFQAAEREKA